jgi:hypothetical protein
MMAIPYVGGAIRGWTKRRTVRIVTKTVVDHVVTQTAELIPIAMNVQPMPAAKVNRKPEEQRSWEWFNVITLAKERILKVDDVITVDGISYRIESTQNWAEAGYRRYDAYEDYTGALPEPPEES